MEKNIDYKIFVRDMKDSSDSKGHKCNYDNKSGNSKENNCRFFDSDIPCGFQDINPELFTIIAQILGDVISKDMPFNVQNALGNWFSLLGQTILTYNAQQQYFEDGPGNIYHPKNRNSGNSDCPGNNGESMAGDSNVAGDDLRGEKESKLESKINSLEYEIRIIKKEIRKLNKTGK